MAKWWSKEVPHVGVSGYYPGFSKWNRLGS